MTTLKQCLSNVKASIDAIEIDDLSAAWDDLDDIVARADQRLINDQQLYAELEALTQKVNTIQRVAKRNALLNRLAVARIERIIREDFAGKESLAVESMLGGTQISNAGARDSLEVRMKSKQIAYFNDLMEDLQQDRELYNLFLNSSDEFDDELARALFRMDDPNPDMTGISKQAWDIAKVMHKHQERLRIEANEKGAWIGKMKGYIVHQSHDQSIISRTAKDDWINDILPELDAQRTFGTSDPRKFLGRVYDNIASGHAAKSTSGPQMALTGMRNIGRSMSAERVLHFRDGDAFMRYNRKYGRKTLRQAYTAGLLRGANDVGMMEMLGPNPRHALAEASRRVATRIKSERPGEAQKLVDGWGKDGKYDRMMDIVDGTANTVEPGDVNAMMAKVSSGYRALTIVSKLGSMILSMPTDFGIYGAAVSRRTNVGAMAGMGQAVSSLVGAVGRTPAEKIRVARQLGIFQDHLIQAAGSRFTGDRDFSAKTQRWVNAFFKINGAAWWTDNLKMSAAISFAGDLGSSRNVPFADLHNADMLSRSGINEAEWNLIRKTATEKDANGNDILIPENVRQLSDTDIAAYIMATGSKPTQYQIKRTRGEIETKLRGYYQDSANFAVLTPDAKTDAYMQKHLRRGTFMGELVRLAGSLKSFSVAVMQKSMGSEIFGRGYDYDPSRTVMGNAVQALRANDNGEIGGLAKLVAMMSVLGYGSLALKEIVKGRDAPDPTDPETLGRAILQGGGMGIMGDFFLGETMNSRYGHSVSNTLMGPWAGSVDDAFSVFHAAFSIPGSDDYNDAVAKLGQETADAVRNHLPLQNLVYARWAFDYLFITELGEMLNPGASERREKRQAKDGQTYWAPPSQGGIPGAIERALTE
jgi:hypothetical protein